MATPVREVGAPGFSVTSVTLSASNLYDQALAASEQRRGAVIYADPSSSLAGSVWVTDSQQKAANGVGAPLPQGVGLAVGTTAAVFVFVKSPGAATVSVYTILELGETLDPESPAATGDFGGAPRPTSSLRTWPRR